MVKRKRVFIASNNGGGEEKTDDDNGLSFEREIDEKGSNQSKKGGGGGGNNNDGDCVTSEASSQAQVTTDHLIKQIGHCGMDSPPIDVVVVGGEGGGGGGDGGVGSRRLCTTTGLTLRSSIRTQKRTRSDSSPNNNNNNNGTSSTTKKRGKVLSEATTSEKVKTRRAWELWSVHDTDMFFEALCEYGKDFQKIRNFVMQKNSKKVQSPQKNNSKKGQPPQMIKNKDQVRHFYYRTWHKISKHLVISDDVNRQTQELYGLINYGELRKKIGGRLDEKNGQKLNEMVHSGATTVRCKGKNIRIRTPLCNALKKLNNVEDLKEEEGNRKLPARITVEFRPRHNHSWSRVQSFSQNPRIRMSVNLQRRLTTVIDYLQRRWREPTVMQRNKVSKSLGQERNRSDLEPFLRIMPRRDTTINTVSLKTAGVAISSSTISLKNYRRKKTRCLSDLATGNNNNNNNATPISSSKKGSKAKGTFTEEPKLEKLEDVRGGGVDGGEKKLVAENCDRDSECVASHELTLRQLLALETAVSDPVSKTDQVLFTRTPSFFKCDADVVENDLDANEEVVDMSTVDKEAIRRGWKAADCGTLTFGEIYLLLDRPEKLVLEYEWEYPVVSDACLKESQPSTEANSTVTKLTTIMNRLLLIASSTFSELGRSKQERQSSVSGTSCCRCGHSCPLSPKSSSSKTSNAIKNPSVSRGTSKNHKSNAVKVCSSNDTDAVTRTTQVSTNKASFFSVATSSVDVFRRPILTSVQNKIGIGKDGGGPSFDSSSSSSEKAFKEHLHKILPQQRRSKGRMSKSMVVQRELPLLPKAGPAHSMMTLSFIPSASSELAGSFMPVLTNTTLTTGVTTTVSQHHQRPPLTRVVQLASSSIGTTAGTSMNDLKANVVPFVGSNSAMSLASLPLQRPPMIVSGGINPISAVSGSPSHVLVGKGNLQLDTTTTTSAASSSLISVSSRPSFANRLISSTTSFPGSTSTISPNLDALRIGSDLKLETECTSSSSSIPVMSISESSIRSNLSISPPTISSLLDISLTGTDTISMVDGVTMGLDSSNDKLLDLTLGSSNSFSGLIDLTIVGSVGKGGGGNGCIGGGGNLENGSLTIPLLSSDMGLDQRPSTPIHSPTSSMFKISSPGLEGHWFNGDVSEFSLSNLLNHLESPVKVSTSLTSSSVSHPESLETMHRLAPDMDSQLQCLISESSVDYIAKFEDLAAQISISDTPKKM